MCGIAAILSVETGQEQSGNELDVYNQLVHYLLQLMNRGYDSCGIATYEAGSGGEIVTTKCVGSPQQLNDKHEVGRRAAHLHRNATVGLAHTRWATHGRPTVANAHPHTRGFLSIVHNGVLINHEEIRGQLDSEGEKFVYESDTDSEVILAYLCARTHMAAGGSAEDCERCLEVALCDLNATLEGTWAVVVMDARLPDRLYLLRHGSPLAVGLDHSSPLRAIIASEPHLLASLQYTLPDDHTVYRVDADGVHVLEPATLSATGDPLPLKKKINLSEPQLGPGPPRSPPLRRASSGPQYHYHMEEEIFEQGATLKRALNNEGRLRDGKVYLGGLATCKEQLFEIKHVLLMGCGTSLHACEVGARWFLEYTQVQSALALDAVEFCEFKLPKGVPDRQVLVIAVSQSGETMDLYQALQAIRGYDYLKIGVVNVVNSLIARTIGCGVYLNAGREVAVASTKSFTSQTMVLGLVVGFISQLQGVAGTTHRKTEGLLQSLHSVPRYVKSHTRAWNDQVSKISTKFQWPSVFVLGKGLGYLAAKEGALKIKEVSYLHAEAYPAGALKHGPFALICPTLPVLVIALCADHVASLLGTVHELRARDARVTVLANEECLAKASWPKDITVISLGAVSEVAGLFGSIVVLQLIAFHVSVARGINPDFPRNLAKVVTVQ